MNFSIIHSPAKNLVDQTIQQILVPIYEPGSKELTEFMPDAFRVKVQSTTQTEDCIACGCPEGLW